MENDYWTRVICTVILIVSIVFLAILPAGNYNLNFLDLLQWYGFYIGLFVDVFAAIGVLFPEKYVGIILKKIETDGEKTRKTVTDSTEEILIEIKAKSADSSTESTDQHDKKPKSVSELRSNASRTLKKKKWETEYKRERGLGVEPIEGFYDLRAWKFFTIAEINGDPIELDYQLFVRFLTKNELEKKPLFHCTWATRFRQLVYNLDILDIFEAKTAFHKKKLTFEDKQEFWRQFLEGKKEVLLCEDMEPEIIETSLNELEKDRDAYYKFHHNFLIGVRPPEGFFRRKMIKLSPLLIIGDKFEEKYPDQLDRLRKRRTRHVIFHRTQKFSHIIDDKFLSNFLEEIDNEIELVRQWFATPIEERD